MSTGDGHSSPSDLRIHDLALWFPGVPDPRNEFLGIEHSPSDVDNSLCTQRPVYHSIFAEPGLIDLSDLGVLTLYACGGAESESWGLRVEFSNGKAPMQIGLLGLEVDTEATPFRVDYAAGERIAGIHTVHRKNELNEWLVGIVVSSHLHRTVLPCFLKTHLAQANILWLIPQVYTSSGRLSVYPSRLGEAPVGCEQFHRGIDPGVRVIAGFCTRMVCGETDMQRLDSLR